MLDAKSETCNYLFGGVFQHLRVFRSNRTTLCPATPHVWFVDCECSAGCALASGARFADHTGHWTRIHVCRISRTSHTHHARCFPFLRKRQVWFRCGQVSIGLSHSPISISSFTSCWSHTIGKEVCRPRFLPAGVSRFSSSRICATIGMSIRSSPVWYRMHFS